MGIAEVLTVIFVVLKVLGLGTVASWSWLWVFSPLWIVYGFFAAVALVALVLAGIAGQF